MVVSMHLLLYSKWGDCILVGELSKTVSLIGGRIKMYMSVSVVCLSLLKMGVVLIEPTYRV